MDCRNLIIKSICTHSLQLLKHLHSQPSVIEAPALTAFSYCSICTHSLQLLKHLHSQPSVIEAPELTPFSFWSTCIHSALIASETKFACINFIRMFLFIKNRLSQMTPEYALRRLVLKSHGVMRRYVDSNNYIRSKI